MSAFLPHFNRMAASGAQQYKGQVNGHPGTKAIPRHPVRDGAVPEPGFHDSSLMGLSRSGDAPAAFWPNLYWVTPEPEYYPGAGMPVQVYDPVRPQDTTMIPVPATDLRSLYQARSATLAGGIDNSRSPALHQATQFVRWPWRRSGNGSDQ